MKARVVVGVMGVFLAASGVCLGMVDSVKGGRWPEWWPEEIGRYKEQAITHGVAHGIQEDVYEFQFKTREDFEEAWPYILRLKSEGAPLILESSPSVCRTSGSTAERGVRVLAPPYGLSSTVPGCEAIMSGPPWPDHIRSESGELPEYVTNQNGRWVPDSHVEDPIFRVRARTDIVLIVDGEIVDFSRVLLLLSPGLSEPGILG